MAGGRRSSPAASLHLTSVSALLLLCIFSWNCGHAMAKFDPRNMTALQQHVSFFDRNKDGIITPPETFTALVAIGCEIAFSTTAATAIHAALGPKTTPEGGPLTNIAIYVENIHKAMHGGDTGVYDAKGRFVPEEFEGIFKKFAKIRRDALTFPEIELMLAANLDPLDPSSVYFFVNSVTGHPKQSGGYYTRLQAIGLDFFTRTTSKVYTMEACSRSWRKKGSLFKVICDGFGNYAPYWKCNRLPISEKQLANLAAPCIFPAFI